MRLRDVLDREREERNYFQLERDKINTFWEVTKRQLEERSAELRNKDREVGCVGSLAHPNSRKGRSAPATGRSLA